MPIDTNSKSPIASVKEIKDILNSKGINIEINSDWLLLKESIIRTDS